MISFCVCCNKPLLSTSNFAPKCCVAAGLGGGSTAHSALRYKSSFTPETEPRPKKHAQQPTASPHALEHIDNLMCTCAESHFRNFRRAGTAAADTVVESQRRLKASTSSKVVTPCIDDRRVITSDDHESSRRFVTRHDLDLQCRS